MQKYKIYLGVLLLSAAWGCSSLKLTQADFAWPVESVLKIDAQGNITDNRFSYSVNVKPLFFEETKDSLSYNSKELRIIRDVKGYYYATSTGFKNIYLFEIKDGAFQMYDKFQINEQGMNNPAMNQRPPYIELIDGDKKYLVNNEGLKQ